MAPRHPRIAIGTLAALLLASCSSTPSPTPSSSTPPLETGSPSVSEPSQPAGQPSGQAGMLLNEVGFAAAGEPAFVEVSNTSPGSIDVAGASLRIGGASLALPDAVSLPAGAQLLVLLDGLDSVDRSGVHAGPGLSLEADRGTVELVDPAGALLDRVSWGDGEPGAVASGPGGLVPSAVAAGSSIGRTPGAVSPGAADDWVVYPAEDGSAGEANPVPPVRVMLPISGAILDRAAADLFWYPVPGASSYRIQVDSEPAFASPDLDETTTEPQLSVTTLAAGTYLWRVQTIGADGTPSRFSEPGDFELARGTNGRTAGTGPPIVGGRGVAADTPGKHLVVPLLGQHKDTAMLLLERNVEKGAHPWDADHGSFSAGDPADNKNCAIATIAMVSAFYGGNLSQDRIGYEVLRDRANNPVGPEGDLMYGHGIAGLEASEAFRWALGGVTDGGLMSYEDMWTAFVREIDAGRPVAGANSHHGFVVTGYEVTGGRRLISINDPWGPRTYKVDIDHVKLPPSDFNLWLMPVSPTARKQEPSVTRDSDGDGVVDFDETERFKTSPNNKDTDGDKVPDKQDIASGVFDPKWGYAIRHDGFGRDFDSDEKPTELDKDSDEGGCEDGEEDTSLNGHRDGTETWNFDADDDSCSGWRGTMSVTRKWTYSNGRETGSATTTFNGVFVRDPNPAHTSFVECLPGQPPSCAQIFLATGTITWSFEARCDDKSDSGQGSFEAGTGFIVPEFDWNQQALILRPTADGKRLQYWGLGVLFGVTQDGDSCPGGPGNADAERIFFEILEDAADRNPTGAGIQSCLGRAWEIDIKGTEIAGTCRYRSPQGETDATYTWSLVRVGDEG